MKISPLKIGTRSSVLALAQAREVRQRLMLAHHLPASAFLIVPMSTKGDTLTDRPLSAVGGKGLFTAEIEEALQQETIDIAVHSTKDMPSILPHNLHLSVFLPREDPRDAFIGKHISHFRDLPYQATIGTSSIRRQALIRRIRPDIQIVLLRGNIQTRLNKLANSDIDGTFLAMAGLNRLGLADRATEIMDPKLFPPAPGQGAIAIESRIGDERIDAYIKPLMDQKTYQAISCERSFMSALDGSCRTPLGCFSHIDEDRLNFLGVILRPDGSCSYEINLSSSVKEANRIGRDAAIKLKKDAGAAFFSDWKPW